MDTWITHAHKNEDFTMRVGVSKESLTAVMRKDPGAVVLMHSTYLHSYSNTHIGIMRGVLVGTSLGELFFLRLQDHDPHAMLIFDRLQGEEHLQIVARKEHLRYSGVGVTTTEGDLEVVWDPIARRWLLWNTDSVHFFCVVRNFQGGPGGTNAGSPKELPHMQKKHGTN